MSVIFSFWLASMSVLPEDVPFPSSPFPSVSTASSLNLTRPLESFRRFEEREDRNPEDEEDGEYEYGAEEEEEEWDEMAERSRFLMLSRAC